MERHLNIVGGTDTPQEGVFYAEPLIINNLTPAEATQLSMDYEHSPLIFEEVVRFRNKYIDELEFVAISLANYSDSALSQQRRSDAYKLLLDFMGQTGFDRFNRTGPSPTNQTYNVASSAAGSYVLQNNDELRNEHDRLTTAAGSFIELMAGYFEDRQLGVNLRINGQDYKLHQTALTCTIKDHNDDRVIFFEKSRLSGPERMSIGAVSTEFIRENYPYANAAAGNIKKGGQAIKIANIDDWQRLIDGLNLMALY